MPTSTCNQYSVTADKTVSKLGEKETIYLLGLKYTSDLNGTATKTISLNGQKYISNLEGQKEISTLNGLKYIGSLNGLKNITTLFGECEKNPSLFGGACDGTWYIHVDTTYKSVDNCVIKADNCG